MVVAVLVRMRLAGCEPRVILGFGLVTCAAVSPYIYDYDLMLLGIAAAVLAEPVALAPDPGSSGSWAEAFSPSAPTA